MARDFHNRRLASFGDGAAPALLPASDRGLNEKRLFGLPLELPNGELPNGLGATKDCLKCG